MKFIFLCAFVCVSSFAFGQWTSNGSSLYYNSGSVGIGTSSPQTMLHLQGGAPFLSLFDSDLSISLSNPAWMMRAHQDGFFQINTTNDYVTYHPLFSLSKDGTLVVQKSGNGIMGVSVVNNDITNTGSRARFMATNGTVVGDLTSIGTGQGGVYIGSTSNHDLFIRTNATPRITVLRDGRVGIGTSTPASNTLLHLHSTSDSSPAHLNIQSTSAAQSSAINLVNDTNSPVASIQSYGSTMGSLSTYTRPNGASFHTTAGNGGSGGSGGIAIAARHPSGFITLHTGGDTERLRISNTGNIAIGTTNANAKLKIHNTSSYNLNDVAGSQDHILLTSVDPGGGGFFGGISWESGGRRRASIVATRENANQDLVGLAFFTKGPDGAGPMAESMRITRDGRVGIGRTNPTELLDVNGAIRWGSSGSKLSTNQGGSIELRGPDLSLPFIDFSNEATSDFDMRLILNSDDLLAVAGGSLAIEQNVIVGGSSGATGYRLSVKGKAIAEEMVVQLISTWPDYVFDSTYNLPPLSEVEAYVKTNKHLPEIPSEAEVKENGVAVGEMNALLLKKIEELTLYVIEQNKLIESQGQIMSQMQTEIQELKSVKN